MWVKLRICALIILTFINGYLIQQFRCYYYLNNQCFVCLYASVRTRHGDRALKLFYCLDALFRYEMCLLNFLLDPKKSLSNRLLGKQSFLSIK